MQTIGILNIEGDTVALLEIFINKLLPIEKDFKYLPFYQLLILWSEICIFHPFNCFRS